MVAIKKIVVTLFFATAAIISWILSFALQAIGFLVLYPFVDYYTRITVLGHIFRGISALSVWINPFWSVKRLGPLPETPRKTILMCNHLSNTDPFMLSAALFPWETKYISKSSLFNVPFGGWAMRLAGDIPIYFTKEKDGWGTAKGSVSKMLEHCKQLLNHNIPITVFPEGIRSKTGEIGEFKLGMFSLALESQATILPIAIRGSNKAWPVGSALLDSAKVVIKVGNFIKPNPDETPEQLRDRVKVVIQALHKSLGAAS